MNCNDAKDIVLTEFIDQEADELTNAELASHLNSCAECQQFAAEVKGKLVQPFADLELQDPPQEIWNNIEETINPEVKSLGIWGALKRLARLPRPVIAFNMALVVVLMLSVWVNQNKQQNIAVKTGDNQIDVLAYVIEETEFDYDSSSDFGTAIEEYFL